MSSKEKEPVGGFKMGLTGWVGIAANATAVAMMFLMLIWNQSQLYSVWDEQRQDRRADLAAFRDELQRERESASRQWGATNALIQANQQTLEQTLRIVERLAREIFNSVATDY
jgi:hypothetical protein